MNQFLTLKNHRLAAQPLRDLLEIAGRPKTRAEKRVIASLVRAYQRMGRMFPSGEFGSELDNFYENIFSVASNASFALSIVESKCMSLTVESKRLAWTSRKAIEVAVGAWLKLKPEVAPICEYYHELVFLALANAAVRINAALDAKE